MKSDLVFALELGTIIRNKRVLLHISQQELAEGSGLQRSYISDLERGARNVAVRNLCRICKALDLPVSAVLKEVEVALPRGPAKKKLKTRADKNVCYRQSFE
jgi:transcriptional regulator with XRE-family HTH domain